MKLKSLIACSLTFGGVIAFAADQSYVPPVTEFGQPDFQGVWSIATLTNLERAERFNGKLELSSDEALQFESLVETGNERSNRPSDPDRGAPEAGRNVGGYNSFWTAPGNRLARINGEARSSIIVDPADGKLPYNDNGRANFAAAQARRNTYDGPEVRPQGERCIIGFGSSGGPPKLPVLYNNLTQIVQTDDYILLMAEMIHDARIIKLNGQHQNPPSYPWLGDSIGHFEGNTLVVETTHFHPQQSMRSSLDHRFWAGTDATVTERFTRVSGDSILYQFTVDDPENFSQPWSGELPLNRTEEALFEYGCHEGNYSLPGILAGARRAEKEGTDYALTDPQ